MSGSYSTHEYVFRIVVRKSEKKGLPGRLDREGEIITKLIYARM
jgi:hypothetical protein